MKKSDFGITVQEIKYLDLRHLFREMVYLGNYVDGISRFAYLHQSNFRVHYNERCLIYPENVYQNKV